MIKLFIQRYMAVFIFSLLIVVMGILSYAQLPRESTPEIKQPYIFITTTYVGASAQDVESLITEPIEQELDGLDGLDELTSESRQNFSFIFAEFTSDVTVETALRRVRDRVDLVRPELPADADEPFVREFSSSDWPIYSVVISHPEGVRRIEDSAEVLRDELKRIPGVLDVDIAGQVTNELAIDLDPARLQLYGLAIDDVVGAIHAEHASIPGGELRSATKNYAIAVTGEIEEARIFEDIFVTNDDVKVRLGDLGSARFQEADPETFSRFNRTPAITLSVKKRLGANIIDIVDSIDRQVFELTPIFPEGTEIVVSYDESRYIKDMIADLENNMFTGFVLVLAVTIFFLGFRNSLFVSLAIPFSMLLSFFILRVMGVTLNMIVLFSLILALGMLVDNGIVIVENIFRHGSMGKSRTKAALDGSKEVAGPIIASTLTTCLAFFPIIFMPGIMGDFMSYLPLTVIVVLASSLFVALVINPVFCARFLSVSEEQGKKMSEGGGFFVRLQNWYESLLTTTTQHPGRTVGIVFLVSFGGMIVFGVIGKEPLFFPYLDPERARVRVEAPQGTPLERTDTILRELEGIVEATPASLDSFETIAGRDGGDTESHRGSINVTYKPFAEREIPGATAIRELAQRVSRVTGAIVTVEEGDQGPPTGDDISYEIRGNDYEVLGEYSERIFDVLSEYSVVLKEYDTDYEASRPEYQVEIDRGKAAFHGVSTAQIAQTIRRAINGGVIGTYRYEGDEYDIVVRYNEEARSSLNSLRNVQVVAQDGSRIPLSAVAEVSPRTSLGVVKRRNLNRAVTVWGNFAVDVPNRSEITSEIDTRVQEVVRTMPPGYTLGQGAGLDIRAESTGFLLQAFILALFLIFVVLVAQFNSLFDPFVIMFAVFLSLGGVFWGFALSQMSFVIIMSGIGCIALAGVAVNNCIVLVDYTHILIHDGVHWRAAVIEAGKTRLRPVLLTALTTVLALVPMALGVSFSVHDFRLVLGSESSEWWTSFAWTMLFGLTFATVMTLVVVPTLLTIKYRFLEKHAHRFSMN